MGLFKNIFTWWEGATIGTAIASWRTGTKIGSDAAGNLYYTAKDGRRWVMYKGSNDPSQLPPEWFAWLHRQIDDVPERALPPPPKFLKAPTGNRTGTPDAYRPSGSLERGGQRQAASGDYEAWTPQ